MEDFLYRFLPLFYKSPVWFQNFIGRCYTAIPYRIRYGMFYGEYLKRIDTFFAATPNQQEKMQIDLLIANVNRAIAQVPFYRKFKPISSLEEFRALPIVSKAEMTATPLDFRGLPESGCLHSNTGGSSGTPMSFCIEKDRTRPKEAAQFNWFWGLYGYKPGDRVLMLRGKSLHNNALFEYQRIKKCLNVSCYELTGSNAPEVLSEIEKFKPQFIHAYPSAVNIFLRCIKRSDSPGFAGLKALFLGSEFITAKDRAKFEEFFKAPVCGWYGHSECAALAVNLPGHRDYAFMPFYGFTELLDDAGSPVTELGQSGRIVATSFDNMAQPFIRYDTGDRGTLGKMLEYRGLNLHTIETVDGRVQDEIYLADDSAITLTAFIFGQHLPLFERLKKIQLEQFEAGKLLIHYVPVDKIEPDEISEMCKFLEKSVSNRLSIEAQEEAHIMPTARGKHRFLIQHIPPQTN